MILKLAYTAGMINNQDIWCDMLESRNEASHIYNEQIALDIIKAIKSEYIGLFEGLEKELENNWIK